MCGIAGLVVGRAQRSEDEWERMREDFATLLAATQARGSDATGSIVVNRDGSHYLRMPLPARKFVQEPSFWALMDKIGEETIAVIGHTRFATTGAPEDNENNHPIYDHPVIGVHNGVVRNHEALRERYGTVDAEVDSASIFGLLRAKVEESEGRKLTLNILKDSLPEVEGDFALLMADVNARRAYIARNGGRPAVIMRQENRKLLWISSERRLLSRAFGKAYGVFKMPPNSAARLLPEHAEGKKLFFAKVEPWFFRKAIGKEEECYL